MNKIAYLTSQYPATSHTFIRREVQALRARGVDVATFSIRMPALAERDDAENHAEFRSTTYVLPIQPKKLLKAHVRGLLTRPKRYIATLALALRHRVPGLHAFVRSWIYFGEAIQLAFDLEAQNITHVHNHFANPSATVGLLASKFSSLDFSLTLHGISEFDYPAGLLLKEKLEQAKFVACVSHFGRAQAQRITAPVNWDKFFINRCGIDMDRFLPFDGQPPPSKGSRLRVLHVGRLSPEKGQVGLIEAFARVVRSGVDAELRIIGDGPEEELLRAKIEAEGLAGRCQLLGRKGEDGVIKELDSADAFVMASFMEGLPVVLMEALAARVPVIAPRVAGIPELVVHNVSGLLFAPGDFGELASQLSRLLTDHSLRIELANTGNEMVLREFDINQAVLPIAKMLAPDLEEHFGLPGQRPEVSSVVASASAPSAPTASDRAQTGT